MSLVTAFECSKFIVAEGRGRITNLSLQKALYLAQLFWAGEKKVPLFDDDFEAWDYGPVVKTVYHKFKVYGSSPIKVTFNSEIKDTEIKEHLKAITSFAAEQSPFRLVELTHQKNGAWDKAYRPGESHIIIPFEEILREYEQLYDV